MFGGSVKHPRRVYAASFTAIVALLAVVLYARVRPHPAALPKRAPSLDLSDRELKREVIEAPSSLPSEVSGALHGRIEGSDSRPIAGASVCIAEGPEQRLNCAWSDATGHFGIDRRTTAAGMLYVSAAGYQSLRRSLASSPSPPLVLTLLAGSAAIAGTVVDASGGPIAGAVVRATSELDEEVAAVALSNQDGTFRIDLPPIERTVFVHADADGYSGLPSRVSTPARGLRIVLSAASSILGRVVRASSREPVPGVTISATTLTWPWRSPRTVRSGPDGSFRLTEMSTGVYSVVGNSEHVHGELRPVALAVAETSREIELLVHDATQLRGTVRVEGEPCPRATVGVRGAVTAQLSADAAGTVTFDGLLSGSYVAEVSCDRALTLTESIEIGSKPLTRVWDLERGFQVRGLALSASGTPLTGARVDVDPRGEDKPNQSCIADAHGKFSCTGLLAGEYDCTIAGPTQPRSAPVRVSLPSQSNGWIELRAEASATIRARIEGTDKLELTSLSLSAHGSGTSPIFGHWDADELVFEPLPLGSYELRSDTAPAGTGTMSQLTYDGQIQRVDVKIVAQRLSGRVVDEQGMPMPDVWVRAESASQQGMTRPTVPVFSDEWGAFSFSGLVPGRYRIRAVSGMREASSDADTSSTDVLIRFRNESTPERTESRAP